MRRGSGVLGAVIVALVVLVSGVGPAQSVEVHGDDAGDSYLGSGGLLIPAGSGTDSQRSTAAHCPGCHWAATVVCVLPDGSLPDQPNEPDCTVVSGRCSDGRDFLLLWKKPNSTAPWQRTGQICRPTTGTLMTTDTLARHLHDSFLTTIPQPRLSHQPAGAALINLPVIWADHGRTTPIEVTHDVAGFQVNLTASPRWSWDFGDGGQLRTTKPGGSWPDVSVSHTYRRPGTYSYEVEVAWPAQYRISGLGTFAIPEVVRTRAFGAVTVQQARAQLTLRD